MFACVWLWLCDSVDVLGFSFSIHLCIVFYYHSLFLATVTCKYNCVAVTFTRAVGFVCFCFFFITISFLFIAIRKQGSSLYFCHISFFFFLHNFVHITYTVQQRHTKQQWQYSYIYKQDSKERKKIFSNFTFIFC